MTNRKYLLSTAVLALVLTSFILTGCSSKKKSTLTEEEKQEVVKIEETTEKIESAVEELDSAVKELDAIDDLLK